MLNDAKRGPVVVAYVAHVAGWTVPQVPHGRLPDGAAEALPTLVPNWVTASGEGSRDRCFHRIC